jgi:hypothetical protein
MFGQQSASQQAASMVSRLMMTFTGLPCRYRPLQYMLGWIGR